MAEPYFAGSCLFKMNNVTKRNDSGQGQGQAHNLMILSRLVICFRHGVPGHTIKVDTAR